jgi:hypothetical protein
MSVFNGEIIEPNMQLLSNDVQDDFTTFLCCYFNSDNAVPKFAKAGDHDFSMASFTGPTICDVCRKLLR